MPFQCPKCQSSQIAVCDYAKRTCACIGAIAGAVAASTGVSGHLIDSANCFDRGMRVSLPPGKTADRIINALILSMAGGTAGARLGEFIDTHILSNFRCLTCRHRFSAEQASYQNADDRYDHCNFTTHDRHPARGRRSGQNEREQNPFWPGQSEQEEPE